MTTCVVLLPGAGLGSWIWDEIASELSSVVLVDYPESVRASGSVTDYAAVVEARIAEAACDRVVLVGHSIGTVVAHDVAARLGDRVEGLLSVASAVPKPGRSFLSAFGPPKSMLLSATLRREGTKPPEAALREGLGEGLSDAALDQVVRTFAAESQRLFRDRLATLPPAVRRGYVFTAHDTDSTLDQQRVFAARLGATFTRELATGHLPMLQDPTGLRAAIEDFVAADPR